jgi:methionine synthase II (cobalamin-independent)
MADNLHDANELLAELEEMAIHTTQGSFLKVEDVRRLIKEKQEADVTEEPAPKNMHEAKRRASEHLKEQGFGQQGPGEPGRAIAAREPQPSSRT